MARFTNETKAQLVHSSSAPGSRTNIRQSTRYGAPGTSSYAHAHKADPCPDTTALRGIPSPAPGDNCRDFTVRYKLVSAESFPSF